MHPKQNNMPEDAIKSGEPLRKAAVKKSNPEEPKKFRKYPKSVIDSTPQIRVYDRYAEGSPGSSSASDNEGSVCQYDLGGSRRSKSLSQQSYIFSPLGSTTDTSTSYENTSLGSSITKFRDDFDNFKCKMKIFGESLNLCRCIASDFKGKLTVMDKRLGTLEKRQKVSRGESNYSAIIQQNKMLSNKTKDIAKKLQMCGTEEEMREVAGRLCRNYLHGAWKTVEPAELEFRRISGGLSNFLYYIALPEDKLVATANFIGSSPDINNDESKRFSGIMLDEPKKVLLRIYGQVHGERAMDAIVTESVIFTLLSERRLGPKLHGVFSGGRIEEFIPARPLLTKELTEPALSMKIAEKMAAIHSMDIPLSKEPNWLWKTMGKWLKTVKEDRLANGVASKGKTEEEMVIIKRLKTVDFDAEIEWLKKFLATVDSAVMFCHNDLQEGNILMLEDVTHNPNDDYVTTYVQTFDTDSNNSNKENNHTIQDSQQSIQNQTSNMSARSQTSLDMEGAPPFIQTKSSRATFMEHTQYDDANTSDTVISHISDSGEPRLVLIDFEYCAYNYRGFDLANHFQEWVYDYTNPSHPFYFENQDACPTLEQKEIFIKEYLKHYHANQSDEKEVQEPSIDAVNHLLSEVDAFALASHLFWSLWSIVNASKSQIPFGYWEYGLSRLETYLRLKQEVIKKDKFGFPQKRKICEVDI